MENTVIKQLVWLTGKINCFFYSILRVIDLPSIPKYNHKLLKIGINPFHWSQGINLNALVLYSAQSHVFAFQPKSLWMRW